MHVSLKLEAVCESDALLARRSSWSIPSGVPRSNVPSPAPERDRRRADNWSITNLLRDGLTATAVSNRQPSAQERPEVARDLAARPAEAFVWSRMNQDFVRAEADPEVKGISYFTVTP